jgi:Xaa-Pro aminopeptidase
VLDVQAHAQSQVRPGTTIRDLNRSAWERMENLLEERFLAKGGTMHRPYAEGKLATLPTKSKGHPKQPHGLSHLMGEQEHDGDPFRLYQDEPLRPGLMISNEPGLYGRFRMRLEGRIREASLGIRIEDDLVVTPKGCRNLSEAIPKDPDEIQRRIGGNP